MRHKTNNNQFTTMRVDNDINCESYSVFILKNIKQMREKQ